MVDATKKVWNEEKSAKTSNEIKFQNEIKTLFDIVDQKSLKMLNNNINKLYWNQKSDTR